MSSVRMCDNCGAIFSEAAPGWQTGTINTVDEEGFAHRQVQDRCPDCAVGVKGQPRKQPRIAGTQPDPVLEAAK